MCICSYRNVAVHRGKVGIVGASVGTGTGAARRIRAGSSHRMPTVSLSLSPPHRRPAQGGNVSRGSEGRRRCILRVMCVFVFVVVRIRNGSGNGNVRRRNRSGRRRIEAPSAIASIAAYAWLRTRRRRRRRMRRSISIVVGIIGLLRRCQRRGAGHFSYSCSECRGPVRSRLRCCSLGDPAEQLTQAADSSL